VSAVLRPRSGPAARSRTPRFALVALVGLALLDAAHADVARSRFDVPAHDGSRPKAFAAGLRIDNPDGSGDTFEQFGSAVAMAGNLTVVGSPRRPAGGFGRQGAVFVFERFVSGTWQLTATLQADDPEVGIEARFGYAVAVGTGVAGDTIVVGAPGKRVGSNAGQGAAYVYRRSGPGADWVRLTRLVAADGAANDQFGTAVALGDGRFHVGAERADGAAIADRGAVYVYLDGAAFVQEAKLLGNDGADGDRFGVALAHAGTTLLIGASADAIGTQSGQGSAYVFVRNAASWTQQAKLIAAADGAANDFFGSAVGLDGNLALVGAPGDDIGTSVNRGSGYVFARSGTSWAQQTKLVDADGTPIDRSNEFAGGSVALSSTTAVLGAIGAADSFGRAFVFVRSGVAWTTQARLQALGGTDADRYGIAVALSGDQLAVGADQDDVGADADQGTVRTYTRAAGAWAEGTVLAADRAIDDWLGFAVDVSADVAIAGAPLDEIEGEAQRGSAYALVRAGAGWSASGPLLASDGDSGDAFGAAVQVDGDTALIGALGADSGNGAGQGAVYVFRNIGGKWSEQDRWIGSLGTAGDLFGASLALAGNVALVGAPGASVAGAPSRGVVYVFERSNQTWNEQAVLLASDGVADDQFGSAVAWVDDTALVGAPGGFGSSSTPGAVYAYRRGGPTWIEQKLVASDGVVADQFGARLAAFADRALIGAPNATIGANARQGAVYVFARSGAAYVEQGKLAAPDGNAGDQFGYALAIAGDVALIGAPAAVFASGGRVHRYEYGGGAWTERQRLLPDAAAGGTAFGAALALDAGVAAIGDPFFGGAPPDGRRQAGAVYVFEELPDALLADGFEAP
jgi:hypothetical protein